MDYNGNPISYISNVFNVNSRLSKIFDDSKINENNFCENLKCKEYSVEISDTENILQIEWITQYEFTRNDVEDFLSEFNRFIYYHLNKIGNPPLIVDLSIISECVDPDGYTKNGENFYFDLIKYNQ